MTTAIQNSISLLRASAVEGRSENVRYRQDQLYALHSALQVSSDAICLAITNDTQCSPQEAEIELYLGMDALKRSYERLDFDQSLKSEYLVAFGKNNLDRRVALGLVAVRPSRHSRFSSILTPIVAAIAAGNCIILELDAPSANVDGVLNNVLSSALDQDTFQISTFRLENDLLPQIDLLVDQTNSSIPALTKSLISSADLRTIAVVDRSGDVELAAKAITLARMSPNCASPYSPDLVIVNEYIGESFGIACLTYAKSISSSTRTQAQAIGGEKSQELLKKAESNGSVKIHRSKGVDFTVVELLDQASPLAQMKVEGPYVILLPSRGLVDSVTSQRLYAPLLATYLFAGLRTCKFLSEQINSAATYINHIPRELLIGPASPLNHAHHLHPRYVSEMFSTASPQFVTPPSVLPSTADVKKAALKKLRPTGQRPGHAVGFFEQGIFIGLGSTVLLVLPLLGWTIFSAGKMGWKFIGQRME